MDWKTLQKRLKARGLYADAIDGDAGKGTREAIAAALDRLDVLDPLPEAPPAAGAREINQDGLDLVKHFEGLYLEAYKDPVGIWTIGYGHTGLTHKDGTVKAGRKVTPEEATELLADDLAKFGARVSKYVTVELNDDEFAALVSWDFNTGGLTKIEDGKRIDSTLLKKLNAGDRAGAADELLRWDKAGGKTLAGLTRRRKAERALFKGEGLNFFD